jgi:DNA-binding helix-hairpin-helix protein with protein kinase domain
MRKYYLDDGNKILIDDSKPIGSGGEGSVYKLAKNPNILVKIYSDRALERMKDIEPKIKAMVSKKPGLLDYNGLTIIAWPSYVVYDENKRFVGYVMRRVQAKNQLSHVITPGLQKAKFPSITWYDRLVIAINLAKVMHYLHQNDTVIGDINTSDFFVYPGFEIGVVDTDSFQVLVNATLYHCKVFTPDYTPPEVIEEKKRSLIEVKRTPNHDNYGLAILIFQILSMGVHPFSARIKGIPGFDGNAINYNMENEIFPYFTPLNNILPPKNAMPFGFFPKHVQELFIRAFEKGAENRPSADEWVTNLKLMKETAKKCKKHATHYYPSHFQKCPICAKEQTKDYDYLVEYFKTISKKYVKYETDDKPITVDENYVYEETISGKYYTIKGSKKLAFFFNPKMAEKYSFASRIDVLIQDPHFKKLDSYLSLPEHLIHHNQQVIGYTTQNIPHLTRLQQLLKNTHLGKMKITDRVKMMISRNIADMFAKLEKEKVTVELNQIFIDHDLNPFIPDVVFMSSHDESLKAMAFQKDEYLPHEYYLALKYQKHLDDIEAEKKRLIDIEKKKIEEQRLKDLELIRSPFDKPLKPKTKPKVEEIKLEIQPEVQKVDFEFEKSNSIWVDHEDEEKTPPVPLEIKYDHLAPASIRYHLGVIIHHILHDGHPYKGTYKLVTKPMSFFVENNYYLHKETVPQAEIQDKIKLVELFPNYYQNVMRKSLTLSDPLKIHRPSPKEWSRVLSRLIFESKQCTTSEFHYHHRSLSKCPVCSLGENPSHPMTRKFVLEYKKGIVHQMLFFNHAFNFVVISALMMLLIYVINTAQVQNFYDILVLISFEEKLEMIKSFIGFEKIMEFLGNVYGKLSEWYEVIFGGGQS